MLRIYNIASEMRARGRDVYVLPFKLTLAERRRCLEWLKPDVVVMQGTRHALNRPGLYPGNRIVLDLDDGDFHLPHLTQSVQDAMQGVAAVMAGSHYIADWCRDAGAPVARVVWTGAPVSKAPRPAQAVRGPVVSWAQTRPMTYVHEAALVREVMARVAACHPGTTLRLYDRIPGDDPGFAQSFEAPGLTVQWYKRMPYRSYLASFDDVAVGLAPLDATDPFCRGKSFGKVLGYLDRGVPVVFSDTGEPGAFFTDRTGLGCSTLDQWTGSVCHLLSDAGFRGQLAQAGFDAFVGRLSVQAATSGVDELLKSVLSDQGPAPARGMDPHEAPLSGAV